MNQITCKVICPNGPGCSCPPGEHTEAPPICIKGHLGRVAYAEYLAAIAPEGDA